MFPYIICIFYMNKKCLRTPTFTNTFIVILATSITWAHYIIPQLHHTPTTTIYKIYITYNNHKASITFTYHSPTNSNNILLTTIINQLVILTPHINITAYIGCITYVIHTHLKNPKTKTKTIHYYTWNNSTIIILGGDMYTNQRPSSHILHNLTSRMTEEYLVMWHRPLQRHLQRDKEDFLPSCFIVDNADFYRDVKRM